MARFFFFRENCANHFFTTRFFAHFCPKPKLRPILFWTCLMTLAQKCSFKFSFFDFQSIFWQTYFKNHVKTLFFFIYDLCFLFCNFGQFWPFLFFKYVCPSHFAKEAFEQFLSTCLFVLDMSNDFGQRVPLSDSFFVFVVQMCLPQKNVQNHCKKQNNTQRRNPRRLNINKTDKRRATSHGPRTTEGRLADDE